jgi:NAD(P)-dependent dehydrogenase (short-subunit alcohol dehydrogenase family)
MPVVLITGASSGIGLACADYLEHRSHKVYRASRSSPTLPLDVRDEESVARCIRSVLEREGRIDVVVNNAGVALGGAVENTAIEEARRQFDVNFFGVLRVCRAVLPVMRAQGAGHIINIGSIGGLIAIPYQGLYSASKFALEGLTESLRLEVKQFGIRVVLVEPGDHRTNLTSNRLTTAASLNDPVYGEHFSVAVSRMAADEQGGPDPARIARLLERIIHSPNPRLRYTAGPALQRAAVWLKRLGPYSLLEAAMSAYYAR